MKVFDTAFEGLKRIELTHAEDDRGRFERVFCTQDWSTIRPELQITQANISTTTHTGTIRGLHYQQQPAAEAKMIRCVRGRVFDVVVDLRPGSLTYMHFHAIELSASIPQQLFVPEGFAHGFQSLEDDVQLLYFHTAVWNPQYEAGLRYDDPGLAITWPLPVSRVSQRDRNHPLIEPGLIVWQP